MNKFKPNYCEGGINLPRREPFRELDYSNWDKHWIEFKGKRLFEQYDNGSVKSNSVVIWCDCLCFIKVGKFGKISLTKDFSDPGVQFLLLIYDTVDILDAPSNRRCLVVDLDVNKFIGAYEEGGVYRFADCDNYEFSKQDIRMFKMAVEAFLSRLV